MRRSITTASRGMSNPCGPNHCATSSGSVQARKTTSRGASKTRVMTTCWSAVCTAGESGMSGSFLDFPEGCVEAADARLPGRATRLQPVRGLRERLGLQPAEAELRRAIACDEPGALQHLQVPGDGRQGHGKRLGELVYGRLAFRETGQDGPPGR